MAPRLLGLGLAMAVAGWSAFTLYEQSLAATPATETPPPSAADAAEAHLHAGRLEPARQAYRARVAVGDRRAFVGLAWVEIALAHRLWQAVALKPNDDEALQAFDTQVDTARVQIAEARREAPNETSALTQAETHLNTLLVVALGRAGDQERAQGALHARLDGQPGAEALSAWVARAGKGDAKPGRTKEGRTKEGRTKEGRTKEGRAQTGEEDDEQATPAPTPKTTGVPGGADPHYEFDEEPHDVPTPTPNELQLPGTQDDLP